MIETLRHEKKEDILRARAALRDRLAKAKAREDQAKRRPGTGQAFSKRQVSRQVF
jgi:hypothetical protein